MSVDVGKPQPGLGMKLTVPSASPSAKYAFLEVGLTGDVIAVK